MWAGLSLIQQRSTPKITRVRHWLCILSTNFVSFTPSYIQWSAPRYAPELLTAALSVDQAGEGRQAPGFVAVGYFARAGYNGGDSWVFDEADGRALFDVLFVKAKALVLLVRCGDGFK